MPAPLDGAAYATASTLDEISSVSSRLLESAQDGLNQAKETVQEHPYLTAGAVAVAGLAAFALTKGRSSRATSLIATSEFAGSSGSKAAQIIPIGGESLPKVYAGATRVLDSSAKLGSKLVTPAEPVFVMGGESASFVRPVALDLKIVSADALRGLGEAKDLYPNIPKLTVQDPMLHAAQLVTQFDGNLARLYARAQRNAVHLEVLKTSEETGALLRKEGSGFFLNSKGEIATAYHVVRGGETIHVYSPLSKGLPLSAEVSFVDEASDIALLHLRPTTVQALSIKPFNIRPVSTALVEGEQVVGFGFPDGVKTLHAMPGNFSLVKEVQLGQMPSMRGEAIRSFMMANPGSSGSPIVDRNGKLLSMIVQQNPNDMTSLSVPIGKVMVHMK